jgi:predicted CoA-binding protein
MPQYSDEYIRDILRSTKTIAMVGASGNEMRPSYFAMKYLLDKGFVIRPVNPLCLSSPWGRSHRGS